MFKKLSANARNINGYLYYLAWAIVIVIVIVGLALAKPAISICISVCHSREPKIMIKGIELCIEPFSKTMSLVSLGQILLSWM